MSDDRVIGIPGDHEVNEDYAFSMTVPFLWHRAWIKDELEAVRNEGIDGTGVHVGVCDTGGTLEHKYLDQSKVVNRRDYTGESNKADDGNRHGTHCWGIIAGLDGFGLAPGATISIYKVLGDRGSGRTSWINAAAVQAAKDGCDLLSRSLGSAPGNERPEDQRAQDEAYANGLSLDVVAAGNAGEGQNTIGPPGNLKDSQTVGAIKQDLKATGFSSTGPTIDTAAPGQNIIAPDSRSKTGSISMDGTSMATPDHVGLLCLIIQKRRQLMLPELKGYEEWKTFFAEQGFMLDAGKPGFDPVYGYGIAQIQNIFAWLRDKEPVWA